MPTACSALAETRLAKPDPARLTSGRPAHSDSMAVEWPANGAVSRNRSARR